MMRAFRLYIAHMFARWLIPIGALAPPDFVIGTPDDPYLQRWYLTPWSRYGRGGTTVVDAIAPFLPSVYLHRFLRSDDDRALHDHPWANLSILLAGSYVEHTIAAGGVNVRQAYGAGDVKLRRATDAHRIEIDKPCWSLFVTGPVVRVWGFHCPNGWRPWREFVDDRDRGKVGRGCQ